MNKPENMLLPHPERACEPLLGRAKNSDEAF
jgi:hypothetical protein